MQGCHGHGSLVIGLQWIQKYFRLGVEASSLFTIVAERPTHHGVTIGRPCYTLSVGYIKL
jgi:hypothetical protein